MASLTYTPEPHERVSHWILAGRRSHRWETTPVSLFTVASFPSTANILPTPKSHEERQSIFHFSNNNDNLFHSFYCVSFCSLVHFILVGFVVVAVMSFCFPYGGFRAITRVSSRQPMSNGRGILVEPKQYSSSSAPSCPWKC